LGMVAHIWAGHVGSMDAEPADLPALSADGPPEGSSRRDRAAARD
jgi:hypothetical protein